jgi:hypothetical protein
MEAMIRQKPVAIQLSGEPIVLVREWGKAYSRFNQCPHRGVSLSVEPQEFLAFGHAVTTVGPLILRQQFSRLRYQTAPDSPICGKMRVKTFLLSSGLG